MHSKGPTYQASISLSVVYRTYRYLPLRKLKSLELFRAASRGLLKVELSTNSCTPEKSGQLWASLGPF